MIRLNLMRIRVPTLSCGLLQVLSAMAPARNLGKGKLLMADGEEALIRPLR